MKQFTKTVLSLIAFATITLAAPFYGNILFENGSADLSEESKKKLTQLLEPLSVESMTSSNESVVITGYTDQSGEEKDATLSSRRAQTVAKFIHEIKSISLDRIIVRGSNENTYHILTVTAEGRRLNRRAEITLQRGQKKDAVIVLKKEIPLILNIVEMKAILKANQSTSVLTDGDTITTGKLGFAHLTLGTRSTIDLDENSKLTISNKRIVLVTGKAQISRTGTDEVAPIFSSLKSEVVISGNGALAISNSILFVSVFNGSGSITALFGKKTCSSMEGIAVINNESKFIQAKLPTSPKIAFADTVSLIPGTFAPLTWNKSGEKFRYAISSNRAFTENLKEGETSDTSILFGNHAGTWYYRFQAETTPGFLSLWSRVDSVVVLKKQSVYLDKPFNDTLFTVSETRPFSFSGTADTAIRLFLDSSEIKIGSNGSFRNSLMLKDDLNKVPLIARNPDNSKDTIDMKVLYNGHDEIIDMNDSIMGREAFSTTRHYTFRGTIPNATSLKINGVVTPLDANKAFTKRIKLPAYDVYPVDLEVTYANGYTKTIKRTVERIQHDTPIQQLFFAVLGVATVSALFVFIGLQSAQ